MAVQEDFLSLWKAKFPFDRPPDLQALREASDGHLEQSLQTHRKRIDDLKSKLQKEELVASFVWDLLNDRKKARTPVLSTFGVPLVTNSGGGPSPPVNGSGEFQRISSLRGRGRGPGKTDDERLGEFDLGPRPSKFFWVDKHNEDRGSIVSLSGHGVVDKDSGSHSSRVKSSLAWLESEYGTKPSCGTDVSDQGHVQLRNNTEHRRSIRHANVDKAQSEHFQDIEKFGLKDADKEYLDASSESLDNLEEVGNRSSLTDSEKVRAKLMLSKSNSLPGQNINSLSSSESGESSSPSMSDSPRGSLKKKAPIPTPRPSVKPPMLKKRGGDNTIESPFGVARNDSIKSNSSVRSRMSDSSSISGYDAKGMETDELDGFAGPGQRFGSRKQKRTSEKNEYYVNVDIDANRRALGLGDSSNNNLDTMVTTPVDEMRKLSLRNRQASGGSIKSNVSAASSEDVVYEVPCTVNKEDVSDSESSDDEEPIYYNIMLLKQSMAKSEKEAIYASIDVKKQELERQAQQLSRRFSQANIDVAKVVQPKAPKMTPLLSEADDDTEDVSTKTGNTPPSVTKDSVFLFQNKRTEPAKKVEEKKTPSPKQDYVPEVKWKKRGSFAMATDAVDAGTGSTSSTDELDVLVPGDGETEKLQMRKWVVTSILDSEHAYVDMMDVVLQYMRSLEASADSSQPLLTKEDIAAIFYKVPDLHRIHANSIHRLEPVVTSWGPKSEVANILKLTAIEEYPVACDYLKNYQKAVTTIHKCCQETPQFADLIKEIKIKGSPEVHSLEELLHKPVIRIQRNILVLHDLIKFTPTSHPDYDILQKTLNITHKFLEDFSSHPDDQSTDSQRYLVRNNMIVEGVGNNRKLRQVFLFNDCIACTKQKLSRQRLHFELKWFIPLCEIEIDMHGENQSRKNSSITVERLQKSVAQMQAELRSELRKAKASDRQRSVRGSQKNMEKLKKKLAEQEAQLLLASPSLVFRLKGKSAKTYTLLMSSDYERNDWSETIRGLKTKAQNLGNLSTVELQNHINTLELPKMNTLQLEKDIENFVEEEHLFGSLNVTIHNLQGLKKKCDCYCLLEVDAYGHFSLQAKTKVVAQEKEPRWNEDFEIELEGAQTLRLMVYKMDGENDTLLGKCALELSKAWLRGDFEETAISLNEEMSLTITLGYASRDQTLKRTRSNAKTGLFGVPIGVVTRREGMNIPLIITTCVDEVEKRGMDDVGIYRISGLSSEVQRLKKGFERNSRAMIPHVQEVDINVVTGLLKLYLREMPEALFTDKLYPSFLEGMSLSDPEARQKCMMSLFLALPQANYSTAFYLIEHLIKISKNEITNKMSLQNLSTVFGPTLLRPASKDRDVNPMELLSTGARDAMMQTGILYFFLTLRDSGVDFNK